MDGKTHDALKADDYPDIIFKLKTISSISDGSQSYTISAKGNLTMAGQTREISINVTAQTDSSGAITFKGSKALKMSDFGISPPTAMLGTLKTGDDITLDFTLKLSK
jgi:polyisoprenoid-binding protein YceI